MCADDFLAAVDLTRPGCLLSDVRMPGLDGMRLLRRLAELDSKLPVIMLTAHGDVPMAVQAMKVGAVEFLEKPVEPATLRLVVASALAQDEDQRSNLAEIQEIESLLSELTRREREVLELLVDGKSAKTVASIRQVAHNTVRIHRSRIMKKMRADNVADLIRMVNLSSERGG